MRTLHTDFFVLRSPLLPYDDLAAWSSDLEAPDAVGDRARLETALAADRVRLRVRLAEIVTRPEVRDALYVASPDLELEWIEQRAVRVMVRLRCHAPNLHLNSKLFLTVGRRLRRQCDGALQALPGLGVVLGVHCRIDVRTQHERRTPR